ncbi:hypothetical protein [Leucobacter denitrificans]|uniref:Uncharacterized protein n=1 Tax=Leucobacter denitrificans TaxID=683042 RepID=A0A7G9S4B0_9MICO|nr:hypothetical protein [Leucobacter denitrificans]QNN62685.1 hypothetical protein H9L06_10725 [Leucobacter denitrificans]
MSQQGKDSQQEPTATAPPSVEESVYEEAEYAGKDGQDAADPPVAAKKSGGGDEDEDTNLDTETNLDPDEAADVAETREEATEKKGEKVEHKRQDEDIISLDVPD